MAAIAVDDNTMRDCSVHEASNWPNDGRQELNLLRLTPSIRRRIYIYAGLVTGTEISLTPDITTNARIFRERRSVRQVHALQLVCRTICDEVSAILYAENRYFVRCKTHNTLRVLRDLRPTSVASLSDLTIHLNVASCEFLKPCCSRPHDLWEAEHAHDKPMNCSQSADGLLLNSWRNTAAHLASYLPPKNLTLDLVCDVADHETARRFLQPLQSMPQLRSCAIRLSHKRDPLLRRLAVETAKEATCVDPKETELPNRISFMNLPREIRLRILEYTDLVTPLREVEWSHQPGTIFRLCYGRSYCGGSEWDCGSMHRACDMRSCWQSRSNLGCFCRRHHSAYTVDCHCWIPPTSLFLVCRSMLEDARLVFFSMNRFVVTPSTGCHIPVSTSPARLEITAFLEDGVPRDALQHLRSLEVVFPPFFEDYCRQDEPAYKLWRQTIDMMASKLNLPALSLRIYMNDVLPDRDGQAILLHEDGSRTRPDPFRRGISREQGGTVLKVYGRMLSPLKAWRGLRCFHAHLASPWTWTSQGTHLQSGSESDRLSLLKSSVANVEGIVERTVVGKENHDRMALEKTKPWDRESQWMDKSWSLYSC